ncbi:hypothetical protein PoB_006946900 [Plakobranchus ocellatus]|uniref:Amidase domain-containing protein n=1 Tax=Plakobranchus ocellatus TaxID=259542 RepID=A0AAV4DFH8_9GAST|nr:hypothetical protein PoB_006946900 [Plakobranchus ocellatus]
MRTAFAVTVDSLVRSGLGGVQAARMVYLLRNLGAQINLPDQVTRWPVTLGKTCHPLHSLDILLTFPPEVSISSSMMFQFLFVPGRCSVIRCRVRNLPQPTLQAVRPFLFCGILLQHVLDLQCQILSISMIRHSLRKTIVRPVTPSIHMITTVYGGVGGTVASESALISAGILLTPFQPCHGS